MESAFYGTFHVSMLGGMDMESSENVNKPGCMLLEWSMCTTYSWCVLDSY